MKLHEAFIVTEIALRYYAKVNPDRNYSRHYAIKQWRQDKNIKDSVVEKVILKIFEEQNEFFKTSKSK